MNSKTRHKQCNFLKICLDLAPGTIEKVYPFITTARQIIQAFLNNNAATRQINFDTMCYFGHEKIPETYIYLFNYLKSPNIIRISDVSYNVFYQVKEPIPFAMVACKYIVLAAPKSIIGLSVLNSPNFEIDMADAIARIYPRLKITMFELLSVTFGIADTIFYAHLRTVEVLILDGFVKISPLILPQRIKVFKGTGYHSIKPYTEQFMNVYGSRVVLDNIINVAYASTGTIYMQNHFAYDLVLKTLSFIEKKNTLRPRHA